MFSLGFDIVVCKFQFYIRNGAISNLVHRCNISLYILFGERALNFASKAFLFCLGHLRALNIALKAFNFASRAFILCLKDICFASFSWQSRQPAAATGASDDHSGQG